MVTFLCVFSLVNAIVTGLFVLKSVQLGLRWQVEVRSEQPPSMETPAPVQVVKEYVEKRQEQRETQDQTAILNEWLNGAEGR